MPDLQIYNPRERAVVAAVDRVFAATAGLRRAWQRRQRPASPARILLLRLERIGDLLMALPAIDAVRTLAPHAEIDLVVGGWNADLARAIPAVTRVETLNAGWLARQGEGQRIIDLVRHARTWGARRYDLAINFEPDLRSNFLLAESRAAWTVGYRSGGGGPLLDVAVEYDPRAHTSTNALRLVQTAFERSPSEQHGPLLALPAQARQDAERLLPARRPLVGIHTSGGREIKQWPPERFAAVAQRLIDDRAATIVLTGAEGDRGLVDRVRSLLPPSNVIDLAGSRDLLTLGAVLERLEVFITGDTGPMHLAYAVGTPIVAIFGPSDPARYAPAGPLDRVVRIDLPCAPCNRIRLPPERCIGHTPDCLSGVTVDAVLAAASSVLDAALATGTRNRPA